MPTPAYTDFDSNAPDGTAGSGTTFSGSALANVRALRDMAIAGRAKGFVNSRTQGTGPDANRPQFLAMVNATLNIGFRQNITWSGFQPTSVQWEWNNVDPTVGGSTNWVAMGSAQANTFDGANNITATTNSGGFFTHVLEIWTKVPESGVDLATHIAATGTAVHGLGSIATQNSTNLTCSDGALNATLGQTTAKAADMTRARESFTDLGTIGAGGTATLDLTAAAHYALTAPAAASSFTVAMSNVPASGKSQTFMLEIIGGQRSSGVITWPTAWKWIGGTAPTQTAFESGTGRNIISGTVRDGGTRVEVTHLGKGG
jgi:hypothetical protein